MVQRIVSDATQEVTPSHVPRPAVPWALRPVTRSGPPGTIWLRTARPGPARQEDRTTVSDSREDQLNDGPELTGTPPASEASEPPALTETKPPSRRAAILRIGLVFGVLVVDLRHHHAPVHRLPAGHQRAPGAHRPGPARGRRVRAHHVGPDRGDLRGAHRRPRRHSRDRGVPDPDRDRCEHPARTVEHGRAVGGHPGLGPVRPGHDRGRASLRDLRSAQPVRTARRCRRRARDRRGAEPWRVGGDRGDRRLPRRRARALRPARRRAHPRRSLGTAGSEDWPARRTGGRRGPPPARADQGPRHRGQPGAIPADSRRHGPLARARRVHRGDGLEARLGAADGRVDAGCRGVGQ